MPSTVDVSVITPTDLREDRVPYLSEIFGDLCATAASWEWVLCVDGEPGRELPDLIKTNPRVSVVTTGRRVGAASARNLALGIARGAWVASADDDDRIPVGSLDARLAAARSNAVGWVGGLLADLRDGELSVWDCPAPRGRVAAGDLWRCWGGPTQTFPLGPTTLLVEADLLRAVGGWQGLPQGEDFGMVMAVTSQAAGVVLDDVVYHYRKHTGQMMAAPGFFDLEPAVRDITYERGRLLTLAAQPGCE